VPAPRPRPAAAPTSAPTAEDLAWWRGALARLGALDDGDAYALSRRVRVRRLAAGEAFLRAGDPADQVALIREGTLREGFPLPDGRERIRAFGIPGDFAGSLSDLLRDGPARCEVVACTPARLLVVPWAEVRRAVAERPAWRAILAAATQHLYLLKAEREYELLALDATARYQRFRARLGGLEGTLPQHVIASYLGITPEHLSRLRRELGLARPRAARASRSPPRTRRKSRSTARR
jgi:CRP-like cAMP-binding protein